MLLQICQWLSRHLNSFTISKDLKKYLSRFYFFGEDRRFGNIFLHQFHRSDMDIGTDGHGLLHSHPFTGLSFILIGGYREERRMPDGSVVSRIVKPFTFNYLSKKDFHRVDLLEGEAWSIFFTGPRSKKAEENKTDWFFWDRITQQTIPWREVVGAIG